MNGCTEALDVPTSLTAYERDVLRAVERLGERERSEPNGLEVHRVVEEFYGSYHSRTYDAIGVLVERNLVEREDVDRRERVHRLTPDGKAVLCRYRRWLGCTDRTPADGKNAAGGEKPDDENDS